MRPPSDSETRPGPRDVDVLVVGAGPAGLAVGACLARAGHRPVLLEKGDVPGWSWASHYETLRLHTARRSSSLPFFALPPGDTFPSRAELAEYLVSYARHFRLDVRTGVTVERVTRGPGGLFLAESSAGAFRSRACVVATGAHRLPRMPDLPGRELFRGRLLHSSSLRSGRELAPGRVLVAGLGNSGGDLAADLASHGARVTIAVGRVAPTLPLRVAGLTWRTAALLAPDLLGALARRVGAEGAARRASASFWAAVQERHAGDLRPLGLPLPSREELRDPALWSRPPLTSTAVLAAVRRREVDLVPPLVALRESGAVLADGRTLSVDAVVLATGFRHGLEELLGALLAAGGAPADGAVSGAPGLFLCGYAPELRLIARSARRTARLVARAVP